MNMQFEYQRQAAHAIHKQAADLATQTQPERPTLAQWLEMRPRAYAERSAKCPMSQLIFLNGEPRAELFNLADYCVSSSCGVYIIVIPRPAPPHTPGAWHASGDLPEVRADYQEDRCIVTADFDEDARTGSIIAVCRGHGPQLRANTALIAAAPDIFAALGQLQANPNDPRAHRQALDALAKARPTH